MVGLKVEKFIEFLKKNWWPIVLAIVPSVFISLYFFYLGQDKRSLSISLASEVPIIAGNTDISRLRITYGDATISSLTALQLVVKNDGNQPIHRSDFDAPLVFNFSGQLPEPPVVNEKSPKDLSPKLYLSHGNRLELQPLLLNPGDWFSFKSFIVNNPSDDPVSINGRLSGIKSIMLSRPMQQNKNVFDFFTISSIAIAAASIFTSSSTLFRQIRLFREPFSYKAALESAVELESKYGPSILIQKEFQIYNFDIKSALLLIRIRLESELRSLATASALFSNTRVVSLGQLSRHLNNAGIIPNSVKDAIGQLSPLINRELHEIDSYLSQDEFESLKRLGIDTIAALKEINSNMNSKI